jgi:hypothetical protein
MRGSAADALKRLLRDAREQFSGSPRWPAPNYLRGLNERGPPVAGLVGSLAGRSRGRTSGSRRPRAGRWRIGRATSPTAELDLFGRQAEVCERSTDGGRTWPDTPQPITTWSSVRSSPQLGSMTLAVARSGWSTSSRSSDWRSPEWIASNAARARGSSALMVAIAAILARRGTPAPVRIDSPRRQVRWRSTSAASSRTWATS